MQLQRPQPRPTWLYVVIAMALVLLPSAHNLYDYARMRSWVPTPAQLLLIELKQSYSSKTGRVDTMRVLAHYDYAYAGRRYAGSRVAIHTGADSSYEWHEGLYDAMREPPLYVWVNPDAKRRWPARFRGVSSRPRNGGCFGRGLSRCSSVQSPSRP